MKRQNYKTKPVEIQIAELILESLERGVRPWIKCFSTTSTAPLRITGDEYKGCNYLLLTIQKWLNGYESDLWMTFNQARKLGFKLKPKQTHSISTFYKQINIKDEDTDEYIKIPILKKNAVFNADQFENIPSDFLEKYKQESILYENNKIGSAEEFLTKLPITILHAPVVPHFDPNDDLIRIPEITSFISSEHYYLTLAHECIHHTGHRKRLNRETLINYSKGNNRAREECCAEIGAAMLAPTLKIRPLIDEEHSPYIDSYIKLLKDDPKAFISAASKAYEACNYLKSLYNNTLKKAA